MEGSGSDSRHSRDKLVEATAELLGERAMRITTRDIADRADVQTSLIHRHFGGKDGLVHAVLVQASNEYATTVAEAEFASEGFQRAFTYLTTHPAAIFAFALAGTDDGHGFPGVALHIEQLRREAPEGNRRDPRVVAVAALALMAGWVGIEPFARAAAGLGDVSIDEVRAEIEQILLTLVEDAGAP